MRRLFLLLLLMLLSACAPQRPVPQVSGPLDYRWFLEHNRNWQQSIESLQGKARISLDTPEYAGHFSADVALSAGDSLLISVTGPLGINVGKVFIARQRFVFYNQVMNQFYTGSRSDFAGRQFMQFPIEIGQLRGLFLAQDSFDILRKILFEERQDDYYLEAENGRLGYRIWFDKRYRLIRRIEYFEDDSLKYYKEYSQFDRVDDNVFPRSIYLARPAQSQALAVYFSDLSINRRIPGDIFNIRISDTAQQIDLSLEK